MAVITLKKKLVETTEELTELAKQIDLVGTLGLEAEKTAAKIKKLQAELQTYKKEETTLQKMIDALDLDDDATTVEHGQQFSVEVGSKGNSRSINDKEKLRKYLGEELFMELATVTLKNIDDYLTPPQKQEVLQNDRTKRSMKIVVRR